MLESVKPILLNLEFTFRVDLPPEISGQTSLILTAAACGAGRDPVDARLYDTGFEITEMHPGDIRTLEVLFDRFGRSRASGDWGTLPSARK